MTMKNSQTDYGSMAIIAITVVLFVAAVFLKGFTKELLVEAGVFLVSIKLILQSQKIAAKEEQLMAKLNEMSETLARLESTASKH